MQLRHLLGYGFVLFGTIILALSPYIFDGTQLETAMTSEGVWTDHKRARSISIFLARFVSYLGFSALFICLGLIVGVIGYHWAAGLSWLDALVEASMILSGMGPISPLSTTSAKLFASLYALFSGLIFVLAMGIVLSPLVYGLLRQFHVNFKEDRNNF